MRCRRFKNNQWASTPYVTRQSQRVWLVHVLALVATLCFTLMPVALHRAHATSSTITGTVFQDFNSNGLQDSAVAFGVATDVGVSGIRVRAFDATGAEVGSTTTGSLGAYSLAITNASSNEVRIEFEIPDDNPALASLQPSFSTTTGASGSTFGSTIQFATIGDTGVNLAVNEPSEFCQNNPYLAVSRQCMNSVTAPSLWVSRYDGGPYTSANGYSTLYTNWSATQAGISGTTGSVHGLAWDRQSGQILSAAYVRAYAALYENPVGTPLPGALFSTAPNGTKSSEGTGGTTQFLVDLESLMAGDQFSNSTIPASGVANQGFTGYVPSNAARNLPLGPDSDINASYNGVYEEVGKTGIGDMDTDLNGNLYVVSLYTRELYRVPLPTDGSAPTSMQSVGSIVQNVSCTRGTARPFGVTYWRNNFYMGVVCDGSQDFNINDPNSASDERNVTYSVVRYSPSTQSWGTFLGPFPLYASAIGGNFKGSPIMTDQSASINHNSWRWNPWTDNFTLSWRSGWEPLYPSPMPSDLQFDRDGSLIVSMRDRTGDRMTQYLPGSKYPDGSAHLGAQGISGGDMYRICRTGVGFTSTDYVWEGNPGCSQSFNNFGYVSEYYRDDYGTAGVFHADQSAGMLEYVAGFSDVVNTAMDPYSGWNGSAWDISANTYSAGGLSYYLNSTGDRQTSVNSGGGVIFSSTPQNAAPLAIADGSFGKIIGMGDVEALCDQAPVQIGDRLWTDTDGDGIQDPGEEPIAGVTVRIYDASGAVVSTAVTNANGEYRFSSNVVEATDGGATVDASGGNIKTNTPYTIRFNNPDDYTGTGPLSNVGLTTPLSTTSTSLDQDFAIDSSGTMVSGFPQISVPGLAPGENNFTFDAGFVPTVSVGDFVWLDSDRDGIQDSGESGIEGVTLSITKADGSPVFDVSGNPITTTTTNANGRYEFSILPVGQYTVSVVTPVGLVPTVVGSGSGSSATDSSTSSATSTNLTAAGASDLSLDFGFVTPRVSVGDYVWFDSDRDGKQETGEAPLSGVTLSIIKADGSPVFDVFGNQVTTAVTDVDGRYSFDDLPPGQYMVSVVTPPAGFEPTLAGVGSGSTDSSRDTATSTLLSIDGSRDATLDFGFWAPPAVVGSRVWNDLDRDGIQDSDEPGVAGVILTLTTENGDIVRDLNGNLVGPTETDVNGNYLFSGLPLGASYKVTVTYPNGATATIANAGDDTQADSSTRSATTGLMTARNRVDLSLDFGLVLPVIPAVTKSDGPCGCDPAVQPTFRVSLPDVVDQSTMTKPGRATWLLPSVKSTPSRGASWLSGSTRLWDAEKRAWSREVTTGQGTWTVIRGDVRFTPAPGFLGVATVPFRMTDSKGKSALADLYVTVVVELPQTGTNQLIWLQNAMLLLVCGFFLRRRRI